MLLQALVSHRCGRNDFDQRWSWQGSLRNVFAAMLLFLFYTVANAAPVIFSGSTIARPGDVVSVQGSDFGSSPTVWCATDGGTAVQLSLINSGNDTVTFQLPTTMGLFSVYVKNGSTSSNTVFLNRANPMHFDTPEVAAGGTFRIFGRNLYLQVGSTFGTPRVDFVSGSNSYTATVNAGPSYNSLSVTAPSSIPNGTYSIHVANGWGGWTLGKAVCPQQITVRSSGPDTFSLGVPWAADLTFGGNVYNVKTDSRLSIKAVGDGVNNDQAALQNAINVAGAAGGGVVYLPAGTYKVSSGSSGALMNFTSNNVVVQGAGQSSTTINFGYGNPPSGQSWLAMFYNVARCGMCDLTIQNLNQNNAWLDKGSISEAGSSINRIFLKRVTANLQNANRIELRGDRILVADCNLSSIYTLLFMSTSTNYRVANNYLTQKLGVHLDTTETNYGVVEGNTFSLDANGGAIAPPNVRHGMAIGFGQNSAILNNTWSTFNGTPTYNNDGESILSEGGAGSRRGEEIGMVVSASGGSMSLSQNTTYVAGTSIAIINGLGRGQWRNIVSRNGSSITIDSPWAVTPTSSSRYAVFLWSTRNVSIYNNTFNGWLRGIWMYQGSTSDLLVNDNSFVGMDGIYLMSCQNAINQLGQFNPIWNTQVWSNILSSSAATATHINLTADLQQTTTMLGTLGLNNEVRNNAITGTGATFFQNDPAWSEGYVNYLRVEPSPYNETGIPVQLGCIFQSNSATNVGQQAFLINGGAYQTTLAYNTSTGSAAFLTDTTWYWNTSGTHASVGTVIYPSSSAPPAPTGLTATAGNAQVTLNWNASTGATSYNIYRGTSSGGQSGTPIATNVTGTSYNNTGLTNGTTYYYKVAAVNSAGTSGMSNEASATPTASLTAWVTGTTTGTVRNNYSGFVGMKFTTGSSPVTVKELGRWIVSGNSGSHTVKLTLASTGADVAGGSVTINTSGKTAGQYAYVSLSSPITLPANTSYYLTTQEVNGGDSWLNSNTTLTTTSVASCNNAEFYASGWVADNATANTTFGPVSFRY